MGVLISWCWASSLGLFHWAQGYIRGVLWSEQFWRGQTPCCSVNLWNWKVQRKLQGVKALLQRRRQNGLCSIPAVVWLLCLLFSFSWAWSYPPSQRKVAWFPIIFCFTGPTGLGISFLSGVGKKGSWSVFCIKM